tara:strand:+ start:1673 stop:4201 length:2529 start_codon:yes stop_codon:yes gene_type:complete
MTKIIEFANKHNISWRPMKLEITNLNGKIKKLPQPIQGSIPDNRDFYNEDWVKNTMPKLQKWFMKLDSQVQSQYHIALDTQKVYQLDIDHMPNINYSAESKMLLTKFLSRCSYYKSTTKQLGKHIFFRLDEKLHKKNTKLKTDVGCELYKDLEILSGVWAWCPSDAEVINEDMGLSLFNIEDLPIINDKPVIRKVKKNSQTKKKNEDLEMDKTTQIFKYMDIISRKYLDDYSDWLRILYSLKTENEYKLAKYISMKSNKYNEYEFNRKWEELSPNNITIATAYYYAKISNAEKYREIQLDGIANYEYDFLDSDDTQAKLFLDNNENNIVYLNGNIYIYIGNEDGTKGRWFEDDKLERTKKIMSDYLSGIFIDYSKLLSKLKKDMEEDEDVDEDDKNALDAKIKNNYKLIKMLKNCCKINSITEKMKQLLSVMDFSDIEFDTNGYLVPFLNTCYDLKTHNWVGTRRENYVLETAGYNWKPPTDEQISSIDTLFEEIFPNEDVRQEYIHFLATSLYGITIEKFIIANGGGGNGKGVINELVQESLGSFAYVGNNAVLLQAIKDGGNPAIANMDKKRFINFREPDEKKSFNLNTIKELTGGKGITARKLYSNEDKVNLVATFFVECNKKPTMTGDLGASIQRRLRDIPFEATYTNDPMLLSQKDELNYIYPANTYYKSLEFQREYKYAMFAYLIHYCKEWEKRNENKNVCEKLYECEIVSNRTKKYIQDNDNVYSVLKQHYVLDMENKQAFMKIREFWYFFKDSEFYKTLSKHEQNKQYAERNVLEHIKTSSSTRAYYKDRWVCKDELGQVHNYKNVLKFWRAKTFDEIKLEQEEDGDLEELEFI